MQSEGRLLAGQRPRYAGVMDAYRSIVRADGLAGLWTGLGPAVARNSIINATELASYEQCKEALIAAGAQDGLPVHIGAGVGAGLMATLIGNPVDVIKTRVMSSGTPGAAVYRGALHCAVSTLRGEGLGAFYQGVVPQFFRLTGWSVVMFVTMEQLKKAWKQHM
jgi:solute carrier family 25 uncoupling protein 8/9